MTPATRVSAPITMRRRSLFAAGLGRALGLGQRDDAKHDAGDRQRKPTQKKMVGTARRIDVTSDPIAMPLVPDAMAAADRGSYGRQREPRVGRAA